MMSSSKRKKPLVTMAAMLPVEDLEEEDLVTDLGRQQLTKTRTRTMSVCSEDALLLQQLHDSSSYDAVSSPGGSSTASGPTYVRPAGFEHHAQEILAGGGDGGKSGKQLSRCGSVLSRHSFSGVSTTSSKPKGASGGAKKKKGLLLNADFRQDGVTGKRIEGVPVVPPPPQPPHRAKGRKEPLPMKQRALPQSFWQQPNVANPQPPGLVFTSLPPLPLDDIGGGGGGGGGCCDMTPVEEVTGALFTGQNSSSSREDGGRSRADRIISNANTDLLFSLFNSVEEEEAQRRIHVVRRGRPKKSVPSHFSRVVRDEDPCLNSTCVESILPLIPERGLGGSGSLGCNGVTSSGGGGGNKISQGTQVIKIMSISHGDRSVELPSLNVEHNYPHLLSELVMKL